MPFVCWIGDPLLTDPLDDDFYEGDTAILVKGVPSNVIKDLTINNQS